MTELASVRLVPVKLDHRDQLGHHPEEYNGNSGSGWGQDTTDIGFVDICWTKFSLI